MCLRVKAYRMLGHNQAQGNNQKNYRKKINENHLYSNDHIGLRGLFDLIVQCGQCVSLLNFNVNFK